MPVGTQPNSQKPESPSLPERVLADFRAAHLLAKASTLYLALLLFIAPLKLGISLNNTGVAFFPLSLIEWQVSGWPPSLMPVLTGLALLLVIAQAPPDWRVFRQLPHVWLPLVILLLASFIGLIRTTELDFALNFVWHMLGIVAFGVAVLLHLARQPSARWFLLIAITAGACLAALQGWHQVLWGFDQNREATMQMIRRGEIAANPVLLNKLEQRRAFARFTYPNSYAAHLLLTMPIVLFMAWRSGRYVSPPRLSQIILAGGAGIATIGAFLLAGSRAAVVALALGGIATVIAYSWRYRNWLRERMFVVVWGLIGALLLVVFVFLLVQQGRTLSSLEARGDYYRSAWLMFLQSPLLGVGMGEFFPWHLRLKPPGAEETRLVHNLFLHFLSQTGLVGGLGALYFLLSPALIWYRSMRRRLTLVSSGLWIAIFLGWASWAAHALADFNVHIPGTMITVVALPILGIDFRQNDTYRPTRSRDLLNRAVLAVLAITSLLAITRWPGEMAYQAYHTGLAEPMMVEQRATRTEQVADVYPHSPYPWDWLGKEALRQKNYDIAIHAFQQALQRTPHRAAYHAFLAEAYLATDQRQQAQEQVDLALLWYPHKPAYQDLAQRIATTDPPDTASP